MVKDSSWACLLYTSSSKLLTEVQDQLITLMVKDIAEQIFNATVANW